MERCDIARNGGAFAAFLQFNPAEINQFID
jgi:hypothetical protein